MVDAWAEFGFSQNPYATAPIPASEFGEYLLVGRERELLDLAVRITSSTTIPVLVGANGVGKTSIVSVASHRLRSESQGHWPRYLILQPPLQLGSASDVEAFERAAYYEIAKVLLEEQDLLRQCGVRRAQIRSLSRWLKNPTARQNSFGISTPLGGGSLQTGTTPSDSEGFKSAGLKIMIDDWLEKCFPDFESGGIICVIDNLEILKSSERARTAVEALRDGLFSRTGLRWVLCGTPTVAGGGALFSARMEGRIAPPIEIRPLPQDIAPELISRRLQLYGSDAAYVPVDERMFQRIYSLVNFRLRSALDLCQQYAIFLHGQNLRPQGAERSELLDRWLASKSTEYTPPKDAIGARSWRLFDELCDVGGEVRGVDADILRFSDALTLEEAATPLVRLGLVDRAELDLGEFLLSVTTPGWLVSFQRRDFLA